MRKTPLDENIIRKIKAEYAPRFALLEKLALKLEEQTGAALDGVPRVDRISFRAKEPDSFAKKGLAVDRDGLLKYRSPLAEIEDQVAGRVLVFFRRDIDIVIGRLRTEFTPIEHSRKSPADHRSFAYESEHLVLMIPPHATPAGWNDLTPRPTTFEMQVRTLFMHAYAEPEHDISYKAKVPLTDEEQRKIAWAAANAWGGDAIFEQILDSLASRTPSSNDEE